MTPYEEFDSCIVNGNLHEFRYLRDVSAFLEKRGFTGRNVHDLHRRTRQTFLIQFQERIDSKHLLFRDSTRLGGSTTTNVG